METYVPARKVVIPIDHARAVAAGMISANDSTFTPQIEINLAGNYIMKDDLAVLDIIASIYTTDQYILLPLLILINYKVYRIIPS